MSLIIISIIAIAMAMLTWHRFEYGVVILFALLPTYLVRFSIGPFPSTLLEVLILIIISIGAVRYRSELWEFRSSMLQHKLLFIGVALLLIGATIGVVVSTNTLAALGEWKAFFVEPTLLFIILLAANNRSTHLRTYIIGGLVLSGITTALLAIYQGVTGDLIAAGYQGRATGWYGFPNGVGLYLGMLWPILFANYPRTSGTLRKALVLCLVLAPLALLFSKSTGALIAIIGTVGILLILFKKSRIPAIILACIVAMLVLTLPSLSPIRAELLFADRSGQIRVSMWKEATVFLLDNPILGSGMASYTEAIEPYHTTVNGEGIEIFHHPHNIFLTMWTNAGLLGLLGFIFLILSLLRAAYIQKNPYYAAMIVGFLVLGMVDSPYIKNDLAVMFWVLVFFVLSQRYG